MGEKQVERRLAAILAADVVGYSRMMGTDEEGTLGALQAVRKSVIEPRITEHRGRIVNTPGDAMLVEFGSVVDAVRCAVDIQRSMAERNCEIPQEKRIEFRIGINIGDVIIDPGGIYGDGVNVAARLEALAEPGGIYVSRVVHDQVRNKLSFNFQDMGEHTVKNIAGPVSAYRIAIADMGAEVELAASGTRKRPIERPSIAVLPFVNMSGDPEQEYFADGISEEIITGLSKLRWFFVIARNSSFAYRGKVIDVKRTARELGVRYVLEGSVRKAGSRVRINSQLIDAATGNHIWADRYDGDLGDIFALQDEITKKVIAAIEPRLLEAEAVRSQSHSREDIGAWDMVMRANSLFWRLTNTESESAIAMLNDAVQQHPDYAPAHSLLAFFLLMTRYAVWSSSDSEPQVMRAATLAARAAQLDDGDPWAHLALGFVAITRRRTDEAVDEFGRTLALNPNFAAAHGYLGLALALDGRSNQAVEHIEEALRMSPHDPQNSMFTMAHAVAEYMAGRFTEAVSFAQKSLQQREGLIAGHRIYIASLAQANKIEEAHAALERLRELQPNVSIAWVETFVPYTAQPMVKFIEGLRKAGLE